MGARFGQFSRVLAATITAWDARVFARALAIGALALGIAWLLTAATDEGAIAWGVRAGRTLPMTPVCAAIGAWLAIAPLRARGDVRALAALGRAPWKNGLGAVLGGASTALVAASLMAASSRVDVTGFFPIAHHGSDYVFDEARGTFVDRARGYQIGADGSFTKIDATAAGAPVIVAPSDGVPRDGRAAAALATALAGLALPLLAASVALAKSDANVGVRASRLGPRSGGRAALATALTAAATILLFHGAAAGRFSALFAALPPAALLVVAIADLAIDPR
jgi:hypothetical protein